jgi:hypothetical protein
MMGFVGVRAYQNLTFCPLEYGKWRQGSGLMMPLIQGQACSGLLRFESVKTYFPLLKSDDVRLRLAALVRSVGTNSVC